MLRTIAVVAVALAGTMFLAGASAAEKKAVSHSHEGTVVSAANGKLTMTGKDKKEHSHDVLATAKITIDGKDAKLDALKKGMAISVTTDNDGKVTAISSGKAAAKSHAKAAVKAPAPVATKAGAAKAAPATPANVTGATKSVNAVQK